MANDLLVPATVLVVVGTTEAAEIAKGTGPTMKPVIAGFILGVFLYGLYGLDTYLGHTFSALIIAAALLTNGMSVVNGLQGRKTK